MENPPFLFQIGHGVTVLSGSSNLNPNQVYRARFGKCVNSFDCESPSLQMVALFSAPADHCITLSDALRTTCVYAARPSACSLQVESLIISKRPNIRFAIQICVISQGARASVVCSTVIFWLAKTTPAFFDPQLTNQVHMS